MKKYFLKYNTLIFRIILFCFALFFFPVFTHALTVQEVPNPRQNSGGWVSDMANILSPETENRLNQMISQLEATNGTEIAVVTVPNTQPAATPKAFTTELFNYWKIGKIGQDNGVLFLNSVGDRRIEIETGYGVEGALPDARVGRIIETNIIPNFKQSNWDAGTIAGTEALINVLEQEIYPPGVSPLQNIPDLTWFFAVSSSLLSYGFYDISKRHSKRPALIKLGSYSRIQFFDPVNAGIEWGMKLGAFLGLFTLNSLALSLVIQNHANWVIFTAIAISYSLYLLTLIGRKSWIGFNKQVIQVSWLEGFLKIVIAVLLLSCGIYIPLFVVNIPPLAIVFTTVLWFYFLSILANWQDPQNSAIAITTTLLLIPITFWFLWVLFLADVFNSLMGNFWDDTIFKIGKNNIALIFSAIVSLVGSAWIGNSLYQRLFTQSKKYGTVRPLYEEGSKLPLEPLNDSQLFSILTDHERVAKDLNSVKFEAWWCPEVSSSVNRDTVYLRAYILDRFDCYECPVGKELTVIRKTQVTRQATTRHSGIRLITDTCQCCDYREEREETIPQESSSSSSGGGGSSSSGSSGGGSFGGGSSGGGGAGGSY